MNELTGKALAEGSLAKVADETIRCFSEHYGRQPKWVAAAPGRVNLIGEHTDYNDGFVLPMAIECYSVIAADLSRREGNDVVQWRSSLMKDSAVIELAQPMVRGEPSWTNYIRGVIAGFQECGAEVGSLDVYMDSTVPLGGGLSSSAALEVATATLLEVACEMKLDPVEKALLCQRAEHEYAGMPCGIMDQFTSVMAEADRLILLDCRTRETELVPFTDPEVTVLIVNTNVKHELTGGEYASRRAQCEEAARVLGVPALRDLAPTDLRDAEGRLDAVVYRRARHVVGEIERTLHAAAGVRESNWPAVGSLMYASHASLRDDYEVSCPELDAVVELAQSIGYDEGVIGCRMTGGGFGGCAVCLVRSEALPSIQERLRSGYRERCQREATLFVSRPAAGAMVLQG